MRPLLAAEIRPKQLKGGTEYLNENIVKNHNTESLMDSPISCQNETITLIGTAFQCQKILDEAKAKPVAACGR